VEDTTPQLGGTLDCQEYDLDDVGDIIHDDATASDWYLKNQDQDKSIVFTVNDGGTERSTIIIHGDSGAVSMPRQSTFKATRNSDQTIATSTWTKVQFNTEQWDTLGEYDNSVNYRFTPTHAGYYQVNAAIIFEAIAWPAANVAGFVAIYKNGTYYSIGKDTAETTTAHNVNPRVSDIVYLNGAGDYIEIYIYHNRGGNTAIAGSAYYNYFSVHKLS